jgi:uncharacterized membrane protein
METTTATESRLSNALAGNYQFKMGEYINKGFDIFKKDPGLFIGYTIVYMAISGVLAVIPVVGSIANMAISAPLAVGFYIMADKINKGESRSFGDFFKGFDSFLPLFLVGFIGGIITLLCLCLLILPGIYIAVCYSFASLMVVIYKKEFWDALETSRKVITKNWWSFFGFLIVLGLINLLGVLCLIVGVFVTIPATACAIYAAFNDIAGTSGHVVDSELSSTILDA